MRLILKLLFLCLFFLVINFSVFAENNIFGIHLAQPHEQDLIDVANLVNSQGGKWGYVTLVLQENDLDKNKWQGIFDKLRELKLIPIIRLATKPENGYWRRPEIEDINKWVEFLDSLNWVVKDRYVILFNEPNHGSEWGGAVDEKSFFEISFRLAKALKEKNQYFFIMMAGFDASAPSKPPKYQDEEIFLRKIFTQEENRQNELIYQKVDCYQEKIICFEKLFDGWASHSYPNPDFSGSPYGFGRGTVRTYLWELELLKNLGVKKNLPVFITETGWKRGRLSESQIAKNFQIIFQEIYLNDSRIKAVTPFILNYQQAPFLEFSWKKSEENNYTAFARPCKSCIFYQQYILVESLPKIAGKPIQIEKGKISFDLPRELVVQSVYHFSVNLQNQGQAIWDKDEGYQLKLVNQDNTSDKFFDVLVNDLKNIKPFEEKAVEFTLKTNEKINGMVLKFILKKDNQLVLESKPWLLKVLPLPSLNFQVKFWPFFKGQGNDLEIQIFDINDQLVFKKKNLSVNQGRGILQDIQNISLGELYRIVILKPGFLPRQKYYVFKNKDNLIEFKSMLPFDFNHDGKFTIKDLMFVK